MTLQRQPICRSGVDYGVQRGFDPYRSGRAFPPHADQTMEFPANTQGLIIPFFRTNRSV